ncbi:MAG: acyl-ACP thioesterase domain-containing protein [Bryobacteraceae bacterium]
MDLIWREPFRVRFYEAEPTGRAAVPAICRYLQEAADCHCRSLGLSLSELREVGRMWVIVRLALQLSAFPQVGDTVVVETWPTSRMDGFRAYRDFRLRSADGTLLGEAASLWLMLDAKTRRPVRMPESVLEGRHPLFVTPEPVESLALVEPAAVTSQQQFRVRWRDLDVNGHANNVCYLDWVLETIPLAIRQQMQLSCLDIQFRNEALMDQDVTCTSEQTGTAEQPSFRHKLTSNDGLALAVAKTGWLADGPGRDIG